MESGKIRVFVAWSGPISRMVAKALYDWLPTVIQAAEPWMSEEIEKGARWATEIAERLEESKFGIICLSGDNLNNPWIHFEAGAISKKAKQSRVCTYLYHLRESDVKPPLSMFQHTRAEKEDTQKLVQTVNNALEAAALSEERLSKVFQRGWPELETALNQIASTQFPQAPPRRDPQDILEEILSTVRELAKNQAESAPLRHILSVPQGAGKSRTVLNPHQQNIWTAPEGEVPITIKDLLAGVRARSPEISPPPGESRPGRERDQTDKDSGSTG